MKLYMLNMGEGIAGPYPKVAASTTVLYSCMGIAMFNDTTRIGGLFHYPAESIYSDKVSDPLIAMLNEIKPKRISVTPAAADTYSGKFKSSVKDINEVVFWLGVQSEHEYVKQIPARNRASYYWDGQKIVENEQSSLSETRAPFDELSKTFSDTKREVKANVWYFGRDGEKFK